MSASLHPSGERRQLWILKYRYQPDEWDTEGHKGVGLVGSTTFSLFFVTSAEMEPEEIYASIAAGNCRCVATRRYPKKSRPNMEGKNSFRRIRGSTPSDREMVRSFPARLRGIGDGG
jgi:hypothetical protein